MKRVPQDDSGNIVEEQVAKKMRGPGLEHLTEMKREDVSETSGISVDRTSASDLLPSFSLRAGAEGGAATIAAPTLTSKSKGAWMEGNATGKAARKGWQTVANFMVIANAPAEFEAILKWCLELGPEDVRLEGKDIQTKWSDLDPAFKAGESPTQAQRDEQVRRYEQHRKWAKHCGLTESTFKESLSSGRELSRQRRGLDGIHRSLQCSYCNVITHAVLCTRCAGVEREARRIESLLDAKGLEENVLDGDILARCGWWALAGSREYGWWRVVDRWLELASQTDDGLRKEAVKHKLPGAAEMETRVLLKRLLEKSVALWDQGAHIARLMCGPAGAERYKEIARCPTNPPRYQEIAGFDSGVAGSVPPNAFELDTVMYKGNVGRNVHNVWRGDYPKVLALWRFTWEAACREVVRRYGNTPPVVCLHKHPWGQEFGMRDLYEILFHAADETGEEEAQGERKCLEAMLRLAKEGVPDAIGCMGCEGWEAAIAAHDANPVRPPGQAEWRKEALDQLYLKAAIANPAFMEGRKAFRKCPTGKEIGSYGPWEATLELRRQLWRHFVMAREKQDISGQSKSVGSKM